MLPDLRLILIFVYSIIESFQNILIRCLIIGSIVIYYIIIILNILSKIADCIELRVVEGWSI